MNIINDLLNYFEMPLWDGSDLEKKIKKLQAKL